MDFSKTIIAVSILMLTYTSAIAQQGTWSIAMGGMLETTKLFNTEDKTLGRGTFSNTIRPSLGLLVGAGWQKNKLSLQLSVAIKKNVVRATHSFEYNDVAGTYKTNLFQQESFFAVEPLVTVGYLVPVKNNNHWQFGLLAGFAFNNKNTYGESFESMSTINDTVGFGYYTVGGDDFYHVFTPELGASVEFHQSFGHGKFAMVYGLQNKWGLTPLIKEPTRYYARFDYQQHTEFFESAWAGRITNVSFYVQFRLNFLKNEPVPDVNVSQI